MAENAGRIEYEFAVEMSGILKAENVTGKATDKMASDFNKVDKSVKNFNAQTTKAAQGVRRAFSGNLGQAGIQVQQFVGQLQGGQSAMVALAQQSADLGIVLGAPLIGVFVSLAAVLAGTLAPAIFGSVSNIEKLQKAVEQVKAVMTVGADGVANYTDELKKLSKVSDEIAKARLASAVKTQEQAIKSAFMSARDVLDDFGTFYSNTNSTIAKETGFSVAAISKLDKALKLKNASEIEQTLLEMSKNLGGATKKGREFFEQFSDLAAQIVVVKSDLNAMNQELSDTGSSAANAENDIKDLIQSLLLQKESLESGERAAFSLKLTMDGLTKSERDAALALYDYNKSVEDTIEASKRSNDALWDEIESYIKFDEQLEKTEKRRADAAKREQERLAQRGTAVGLTQVQTVETRYEADLEALKAAREAQLITEQEYADREIELQRQKSEQIQKINADGLGFLGKALNNFEEQSAAALTSVVTGAQSGSDALKGLARTILTSVIQAIIQQGIASATAAATAATAQSAANATIAATAAPAAAAVSLATLGANSAPAIAGITSTAAIATALLGVGALAGGRQYGGPVSQGMYRVNETGIPEIYSHGGKDYLMNTKNANIKPLEQGGGGGMQVIVNNNTPYEVFVTQDQAANIANVQIGREAGKLAQGRGNMYKAMRAGTSTSGNARR